MKRLRFLSSLVIVLSLIPTSQCQAQPSNTDGDVRPFVCGNAVTSQFVDAGGSETQFAFGGTGKVLQVSTPAGPGGSGGGCTISNFSPNAFARIEVLFYDPEPAPNTGSFVSLKLCLRTPYSNRPFSDRVSFSGLDIDSLGDNWYRAVGDPRTNRDFNLNSYGSDLHEVSVILNTGAARTIKIGQVKLFITEPIEPRNLIMSTGGCDAPNCPSVLQTRLRQAKLRRQTHR